MSDPTEGLQLHGPVHLASAEIRCWRCDRPTLVHALIVSDLEELEEPEPGEEPFRLEAAAFVYELDPDALPANVEETLSRLAPAYRPTYSQTADATYWANVCTHCGTLQGAFFLHSEPDGPFFGGPEEFHGARVLLSQDGFVVDGASHSM